MKTLFTLCMLLGATLLCGCRTATAPHQHSGSPASKVTFVVSCSEPATAFTGTIVCDGHTRRVSGQGGGTFHATGYEIVGSFQKAGADGSITLEAWEAGGGRGSSSTGNKLGGVRAAFHRQPSVSQTFEAF